MAPTPEIRKAEELAHWRGEIDRWKSDSEAHEVKVEAALTRMEQKQDEQGEILVEARVRRTIFTAAISLVGGGVVAVLIGFATKAIG